MPEVAPPRPETPPDDNPLKQRLKEFVKKMKKRPPVPSEGMRPTINRAQAEQLEETEK
jgi:hypothetical protein